MKILYICSSQFSGSTLISFLLNNHSAVASIGHTTGWRYTSADDFRCSCGARIKDCPLFLYIEEKFARAGLAFDPQDFGTAFQLSRVNRLNRLLTAGIPLSNLSVLERQRDGLVGAIPAFARVLNRQQLANFVLMRGVAEYFSADVYLDNSHSPYRLRILSRNPELQVLPVHLIRDPRGVTLSMMRNSGIGPDKAIKSWIRHQRNIFRIADEVATPLSVRYESLCESTDLELARLHKHAGLGHESYSGDFKEKPHHILGNRMRLTDGRIQLDEKWRRELPNEARDLVERRLQAFSIRQPAHPLSEIILDYLASSTVNRPA